MFAAGLGQTSPAAVTNRAGIRDQNVLANVISGINNEGVRTVSARAMEGAVGIYIVEMEIPENATTGDSRPLAIAMPVPDGALVFATGQQSRFSSTLGHCIRKGSPVKRWRAFFFMLKPSRRGRLFKVGSRRFPAAGDSDRRSG